MRNRLLEQMQLYLSRKLMPLPEGLYDSKYTVKMVETPSEYFGALKLLHDSYVVKGLMDPDPRGIRITPHHLLPETHIMIVKSGDEIIGTGTIVHEHQVPFPSYKVYTEEIKKLIDRNHNLIELSSLAVHPDYRKKNNMIQILISKYYAHFVNQLYQHPYHICTAHPKALLFYRLMFNLQQSGNIINYDFVNNAKAAFIHGPIAMQDLLKLEKDFSGKGKKNFMSFFCSADQRLLFPKIIPEFLVAKTWLEELVKNIYPTLLEDSDLLTSEHHQIISQVYSLFEIRDSRILKFMDSPRSYRLKSRMESHEQGFRVMNISDTGVLLSVPNLKILENIQKGVSFKFPDDYGVNDFEGELSRIEVINNTVLIALRFKKPSLLVSNLKESLISQKQKKIA